MSHTRLGLVPRSALDDHRQAGRPSGKGPRLDTGDLDARSVGDGSVGTLGDLSSDTRQHFDICIVANKRRDKRAIPSVTLVTPPSYAYPP